MGRKKEVVFDEEAPDFDPANPYKDPVAMIEMREHLVREKWIDIETSKIIREKLRWCYRIEGVNHLQKCRQLVQQYLDSTRGIGWGKDGRHPAQHGRSKGSEHGVIDIGVLWYCIGASYTSLFSNFIWTYKPWILWLQALDAGYKFFKIYQWVRPRKATGITETLLESAI